jgi:hypothetical protein
MNDKDKMTDLIMGCIKGISATQPFCPEQVVSLVVEELDPESETWGDDVLEHFLQLKEDSWNYGCLFKANIQ